MTKPKQKTGNFIPYYQVTTKPAQPPTYCEGCSFKCQATECDCTCHDKMREFWRDRCFEEVDKIHKTLIDSEKAIRVREPKFPLSSKYGLSTLADLEASKVELALAKAFEDGMLADHKTKFRIAENSIKKYKERITQLEAEVMGLEGCCQVLEKAFGVPKKATLKQIDERIGYFVKLEKENMGMREQIVDLYARKVSK